MDYEKIGCKLKSLRIKKGFTQEYLAEKVDVERRLISKLENGKAKADFEKMCQIANILGVSLDYLVDDEITYIDNGDDDILKSKIKVLTTLEKRMFLSMLDYYTKNKKVK